MPYKPVAKKKAAPKGGGKAASGYKLYTPVKQATIDNIKKMGMTAALKKAGSSKNAEFVQGVKRMYGADRLKAAMKAANKPVAKSADAARAAATKPKVTAAKSADEARSKAMGTSKTTTKKAAGKGLFPGLLSGNYQGKKIVKGKVAGKGYFK
jgi:hypothetical protein